MSTIEQLLQGAKQRAEELNLPYAGVLFPDEAYDLMQEGVVLVDVRTQAELDWVGRIPDALEISWLTYPGMQPNADFIDQLAQETEKSAPVMFICRSGARSGAAADAATQAGYTDCYNVLEGFEGDKDGEEHRNSINGWRIAELPWEQS